MTRRVSHDDAVLLVLNASMPMAEIVGAIGLADALIGAGLKLLRDVEGDAAALEALRGRLALATEAARLAAHPKPRRVR